MMTCDMQYVRYALWHVEHGMCVQAADRDGTYGGFGSALPPSAAEQAGDVVRLHGTGHRAQSWLAELGPLVQPMHCG